MQTLTRRQLLKLLPHGPKAVIIDLVSNYSLEKNAEFINTQVLLDTKRYGRIFKDHFRNRPTGPGHWQLEIGCLSAALLYGLMSGSSDKIIVLRRIIECDFQNEVFPGDTLYITVDEIVIKRGKIFECHIGICKDKQTPIFNGNVIGFLVPLDRIT